MKDKYAVVTGAGSGIGKAITTELAKQGINVLLFSLPGENLEKLAHELSVKYKVKTDFFENDLSTLDGPAELFRWVMKKGYHVYFLVNNAGMAGTSVFESSEDSYIDDRVMVNIRALTFLTRYFIPELKKHEKSYILNVSSLSAFYSIPFKALYSASKAYVLNFSRALKEELRDSPISLSVLCPNGVQTNEGTHARIASHGKKGKMTSVTVDKVACIAVKKTLSGRFLIIPGGINKLLLLISRLLPEKVELKILYKEFYNEVKVS